MASSPTTLAGQAYVQPMATWKVMLGSRDLTDLFDPRLISVRVELWRQEKADTLEIEIHDADGQMVLPPMDATLTVAMGWLRGTGVTPGLVALGSFVVDDVSWAGPPDRVTIKAHSADLRDSFRTRQTRTWNGQTLGAIAARIAAENGLVARCHPDLAATLVDAAEQANQSDMEFLRDLGRRYDAVATVKAGCLIFAPVGAATTATGASLPTLPLTRQMCRSWSFSRNAREGTYQGAEANYHDQNAAARALHQEGSAPRRRLKRVYGSAAAAKAAARAEHQRLKRAAARFEVTLSQGNAQIAPGLHYTPQGFKSEVDATTWLIAHVTHEMGPGGFMTEVEMEVGG